MKKLILFLFIITVVSCSKSDNAVKQDPIFQLPPETQTGANTFGVTINGKVYIPRDPTGANVGGATPKGMRLSGLHDNNFNYTEIIVVDGASTVGFKMVIHFESLSVLGDYILKQSNFQDQIDSAPVNHIFFKIWDNNIHNYAYYGSIENQGVINITRLSNGIVSGNFSGKFVRFDNPNEFIQINGGRFDINSFTVQNTYFP